MFDSIIDVFSQNTYVVTITIGKVLSKIVNYSSNLPKMLGYTKQDFEYKKRINDIQPPYIFIYKKY